MIGYLSGGVVANIIYPDALSCYIERPFWVSWDNDILRVNILFYFCCIVDKGESIIRGHGKGSFSLGIVFLH